MSNADPTLVQHQWSISVTLMEAAIAAAKQVQDRLARQIAKADAIVAGLTIHPGARLLAELLPDLVGELDKRSAQGWEFDHVPVRGTATLTCEGHPALQVTVDDMTRPAKLLVNTIWVPGGMTAWNHCAFAGQLLNRQTDPHAALPLKKTAAWLAAEIDARVLIPAHALWPAVEDALKMKQDERAEYDSRIAHLADYLGRPGMSADADGIMLDSFTTVGRSKIAFRVRPGSRVAFSGELDWEEWLDLFYAIAPDRRHERAEPANDEADEASAA